jgi:hypothetical protein
MVDATAEQTMARGKGRPRQEKRHDVSVKLDSVIVSKAKMIASARGLTLAEFLSDLLRAPVDREFTKEMKRLEEGGSE